MREKCWQTVLFNRLSASKHRVGLRSVGGGFALGTVCHDSCLEMMEAPEKGSKKKSRAEAAAATEQNRCGILFFPAACAQSHTETETTSSSNNPTKGNK